MALGLPFLDAMSRSASATTFPKRFIVFFTGLGTVKDAWVPQGTELDFTLSEVLAPLAPFKEKLLVLEGIDMESAYHGPGDPHQQGIGHALTGTELQEGDLFPYACNPNAKVGWGGGISVDQFLASHLGASTKLGSLELGIQVQNANVSSRISYLGPGQPVPPEDDPRNTWNRLFSEIASDPDSAARRRAHRRRVLDQVMGDYHNLQGKLGAGDREKLEHHLEAVSEIERRLDAPGTIGGSCAIPTLGDPPEPFVNDNYPELGRLQIDQLVMALACDLTRVASLQWASTQAGKVFTWLGQNETHHQLSHSSPTDETRRQQIVDIGRWHAEQLAYLLDKLAAVPEGTGTLLDSTLILWCTDIAVGQTHARRDMPYVLAGGAGGALEMGRYLRYQGNSHNDLLVALCNAMDVDVTTFGNPAYCTGKLPGLGV
ncbi:Tat (twin-arginine translocation) pathway signal sequence domain protein [Chondromyces apiculatus DSM 436]|uniref:Tat (Twin-arginine translocation) pathway signal sequence domain protein n=1 Tax=Chondromyces apiculatus DSM 436 TaxID=1192034 RepID=A0A017TEX0_9BACT|nr:Tat (twin-arginine translocation) pathway signal sequence domain protein [Chondromyces apiculatus DSM 436]